MDVVMSAESGEEGHVEAWLEQKGFNDLTKPREGLTERNGPIHVASMEGNKEVVEWLVKKGVSLRMKAETELAFTPMIFAVRSGHLKLAQWIYEMCEPEMVLQDERDSKGTSVMMYAVEKGHIDIAEWILSIGGPALLHDVNRKGSTVLIWSTHDQSMTAMKWLHERGCALDTANNEGNTAAMFASINGNLPMLQWLHEHGCSLSGRNIHQETLPMLAADGGYLPVLEYLFEHSNRDLAIISACDASRRTVLHFAANGGHQAVIEWIVSTYPKIIDEEEENGFTSLMLAAKHNHPDAVRFLVSKSASLHSRSRRTLISLAMLVVVNCSLELCQWLMERGMSLVERTTARTSAACFACQYGKLETLKWMISEMPLLTGDIGESGEDLVMYAARYDKLDVLKYLLSDEIPQGATPFQLTRHNSSDDTVASIAAMEGRFEILQWLIDVHCPSLLGELGGQVGTACIMNAAARGHLNIIEWLVQVKGIDPKLCNASGTNAFMWAAQMGHINVLDFLYSHHPTPLTSCHLSVNSDVELLSPVLFAAVGGKLTSLRWLEGHGAQLNTRDSNGNSALHWAAQGGHLHAIQWFLRRGFDISDINYFGNTVADCADLEGRIETASWLRQYLAH